MTSSITARFRDVASRMLVRGLRQLARWGGAKTPPGGWRDALPRKFRRTRSVKRSRVAARDREWRETRDALIRLLVWLPLGLCAFLFILQWQTPERLTLQRLRAHAATNDTSFKVVAAQLRRASDYANLSFHELSGFDFTITPDAIDERTNPAIASARTVEQIPNSVKRWDGQLVAIQGFMLPLKLQRGLAVEWLLCRDQSDCCFGKTPRMNHWVLVRSPEGVKPKLGQPVTCSGTLRVGEMRDNGFLTSIYRMDAEDARIKE